jgi:hypothetical protein
MKQSFVYLLLAVTSLSAIVADEEGIVNPKLTHHQDAIMPLSLHDNRIRDPKAKVRLKISETGNVSDVICVDASDYRIAEIAEGLARNYIFRPATQNGKSIAVTNDVIINFSYDSSYNTSKDGFNHMVDFIGQSTSKEFKLHLVNPNELDAPLEIVESAKPMLIKNEDGEVELGQALIEGYVTADGDFRFLSVKKADSPYIAEAALENFKQLRFSPPRKEDRRVVCRIHIPFVASNQ